MGVTFYICDPGRTQVLEKLIDEMEAEDPFEDVKDSAYDRFSSELEANHLERIALSEEDSAPAMAFHEWFLNEISEDLYKFYLTAEEAKEALATLDRRARKRGTDALVKGYWHPEEEFSFDVARGYLTHVQNALVRSVERNGLIVIYDR